jgi:LAO/AO transport system kinase
MRLKSVLAKNKTEKPDWQPENGGEAFAVKIVKGRAASEAPKASEKAKNRVVRNPDALLDAIRKGERTALAQGITLIESNAARHQTQARELLQKALPFTGNALRIGISGVPGAGKSTLIEALGIKLHEHGKKVAVLAVDPSSSITKGSILGDKTRMEQLSRLPNTFIRPSPSSGTLGGVARKSRETMMLCEAAGFDIILVETVGVGQSEITVRSMVDAFLLTLIAGAGDELQGIKKGIMEIADIILINKADGDNLDAARRAKNEYEMALHYASRNTPEWSVPVLLCSALTGDGIEDILKTVNQYIQHLYKLEIFHKRRTQQLKNWTQVMLEEALLQQFYGNSELKQYFDLLTAMVGRGALLPTKAVDELLERWKELRI